MNTENSALGDFLKRARTAKRLTLRDAEEGSGISNAFLSQIESGKVKQPSPVMLHKLSVFYGISYETLMKTAGHPVPGEKSKTGNMIFGRLGTVTADEEQALSEYLAFLRSRVGKRRRPR
jgi:transcriptional regulator with XRE-family HTH domain